MAGVRAEMLFIHLSKGCDDDDEDEQEASSAQFLNEPVRYSDDDKLLLDAQGMPVMMTWESEIMRRSATLFKKNGRILNIGFGMGIIDNYIQDLLSPIEHVIIEAHPDVLAHMKRTGWYDKPNVRILEGRWQQHMDSLAEEGHVFDGIYYDVYQETYSELRKFAENVVGLLDSDGVWSFFHGLGADRQTFYDVYTILVELDFGEMGFTVEYEDISARVDANEWKGSNHNHKYWTLDTYKMPKIRFT